jgi:hypothetical protein
MRIQSNPSLDAISVVMLEARLHHAPAMKRPDRTCALMKYIEGLLSCLYLFYRIFINLTMHSAG